MKHPEYLETDQEVEEIYDATIAYIFSGNEDLAPYDLRGLGVYGTIRALRENNDAFHGESSTLTDDEKRRVQEVEEQVDMAVSRDAQFYPFGHDVERFKLDKRDHVFRQMSGGNDARGALAIMRPADRIRNIRVYRSNVAKTDIPHSSPVVTRSVEDKG